MADGKPDGARPIRRYGEDDIGGLNLLLFLAAVFGAIAVSVLALRLVVSKSELPDYGQAGEFLGYAVGLAVTAASVWITYRISGAANRIARRLGDSDLLDFVDTRLEKSLAALQEVADALDRVRRTADDLFHIIASEGGVADKMSNMPVDDPDVKKLLELEKAPEPDFEAIMERTAIVLFKLARSELETLRTILRETHRVLSDALGHMEQNPMTRALVKNALDPDGGGLFHERKFRFIAGACAKQQLWEGAGEPVPPLDCLPDLKAALQGALARQGVFHDGDDGLLVLAYNLVEVVAWHAVKAGSAGLGRLELLGAFIDLSAVPHFQAIGDLGRRKMNSGAPDDGRLGVMVNRGLILLATIFEVMPDTKDVKRFFQDIYGDPHSGDLADNYLARIGFSRMMYWSKASSDVWEAVHRDPTEAVHVSFADRNETANYRLVPVASLSSPPQAQRGWLALPAFLRRPAQEVFSANARVDIARTDARMRRGESLEQASAVYGLKASEVRLARARTEHAFWFGPVGDRVAEENWLRMLGALAVGKVRRRKHAGARIGSVM